MARIKLDNVRRSIDSFRQIFSCTEYPHYLEGQIYWDTHEEQCMNHQLITFNYLAGGDIMLDIHIETPQAIFNDPLTTIEQVKEWIFNKQMKSLVECHDKYLWLCTPVIDYSTLSIESVRPGRIDIETVSYRGHTCYLPGLRQPDKVNCVCHFDNAKVPSSTLLYKQRQMRNRSRSVSFN